MSDFSGKTGWLFGCVTFGCRVNQYETEAVREAWTRAGGLECRDLTRAQVVLVNSCAVTGRAERDARNALIRLRREAPGAVLVLTGCAARLVADFVPRRRAPVPEADLLVVQERKAELCRPEVIEGLLARLKPDAESCAGLFSAEPARRGENGQRPWPGFAIDSCRRVRPVLKVQDGCSHRCTYCIVPLTRGPHVSRDPEEAAAEAARLFRDHAEIMISGINLGQYGRDRPEWGDFWDLLERLDLRLAPACAGRRRLRISSLEPSLLDEKACGVLARSRLAAPHLHISLQHASRNVLRRMGRGHYGPETLTRALERLASVWPVMGLGADLLVGFPGETPADVDELCRFVEETPFTYAHVFPYSRRPGTPAASFPDQIPRKEKLARAALVRSVAAARARAFWERQSREEELAVAVDAGEARGLPGHVHAVAACYTPCWIRAEALRPGADGVLPGRRDFLRVRPAGLCAQGLLVEPLPEKS